MITQALFFLFRQVLDGLDWLLPNWTPPDLQGPVATLIAKSRQVGFPKLLAGANHYLPIRESMLAFVALGAIYLSAITYHGVVWVLTKVHILGGE